jgi:hypothetical protein
LVIAFSKFRHPPTNAIEADNPKRAATSADQPAREQIQPLLDQIAPRGEPAAPFLIKIFQLVQCLA